MIIDCISDLHGYQPVLKGGDLLIVAGDLTARDTFEQHCQCFHWLQQQDYKRIVVIAGNHDGILQQNPGIPQLYGDKVVYLQDWGTEFEGLKIWGSPWTKTFVNQNPHCKAFCLDTEEELAEKWALIPEDTDILITHSAPHGFLDKNIHGEWCGSKSLHRKMSVLEKNKLWVFGHIHEGYGDIQYEWDTVMVNASHVDHLYSPVNRPIRVVCSDVATMRLLPKRESEAVYPSASC